MSTRTITSPGVTITEIDQSLLARPEPVNNVFITGYAAQGPTDEILNIGSVAEFVNVFGAPRNEAERYFFHAAKQIVTQSPSNLLVSRLPYGIDMGEGFANKYSATIFPVEGWYESELGMARASYEAANYYKIGSPYSIILDEDEYIRAVSNDFAWLSAYDTNLHSTSAINTIGALEVIANGGIVVLNPTKLSINQLNEGYYLALADNSNNDPSTAYDCVTGVMTLAQELQDSEFKQVYTDLKTERLNFALQQAADSYGYSISQIIENFPTGYAFGSNDYQDCLSLMVFKVRSSIYGSDTVKLDYSVEKGYTGSLYYNRTQNNSVGGNPISFNLEKVINVNSSARSDVKIMVNPFISQSAGWLNSTGNPQKKVRVSNEAKNLYPVGVYVADVTNSGKSTITNTATLLGNLPGKLQRVIDKLEDRGIDVDIVGEAGLGTIWAQANVRKDTNITSGNWSQTYTDYLEFDANFNIPAAKIAELKDSSLEGESPDESLVAYYADVYEKFRSYAQAVKTHIFIADSLRCIFVQGTDTKTSKKQSYNFSQDIYWPLRNLYSSRPSSYGAVYGNWIKVFDDYSGHHCWIPSSGHVIASIVSSTANTFPWTAPAGFSRGVLTNVVELASTPTQKQRDQLYKINVNPIAFFPGDGYVIFGQKTLFNKPSAFDRLNVRRLFLYLEKTASRLLKYYLFEPNTYITRARLIQSLNPIFNQAKVNEGVYDYKIICDERNNTPDVIDNNELKISIYIQPVRTAEYILADFIATRTGVSFDEISA